MTPKNFDFQKSFYDENYSQFIDVDVLWCQPIKLIQVVSTSEFHEYRWKDVDFFFIPSI